QHQMEPCTGYYYKRTYIAIDGPGSTGKTSMQGAIHSHPQTLVPRFRNTFTFQLLAEPPSWSFLHDASPYELITSGALSDPESILLALAAFRRMLWDGVTSDGASLSPSYISMLQSSQTLICASRSPLSHVYQGVYPEGPYPRSQEVFIQLYSPMQTPRIIPFPDNLYILIPDPQKQQARLRSRISAAGGKLEDVHDSPDKQGQIIQGYESMTSVIRDWPGVYRILSQEVVNTSFISLPFLMSLKVLTTLVEKGSLTRYCSPQFWGSIFYGATDHIYRVNSDNRFQAYFFPRCINVLIDFGEIKRYFPNRYGINYGDLGCINYGDSLILISIEQPSLIDWVEACDLAREAASSNELFRVDENTRYGWKNLYKRYDTERAWRNITW
ncbi:MAG: hypothetical protein PHS44_07890, partial [Candidatus Dojkabacteria bacterium]|nr:hypothetical protein [Candidatus Dojkabacteria bacterium]